MSKYGKFVLTIVSAILSLTGCLPHKPTREDIIGVWIGYYAYASGGQQPAGSFEFFEDGTFEARDIPREEFFDWGLPPQRIDAQGTWELDVSSNDPFAVHKIRLEFPEFNSELGIMIGGKMLFTGLLEGDGLRFEKQR